MNSKCQKAEKDLTELFNNKKNLLKHKSLIDFILFPNLIISKYNLNCFYFSIIKDDSTHLRV